MFLFKSVVVVVCLPIPDNLFCKPQNPCHYAHILSQEVFQVKYTLQWKAKGKCASHFRECLFRAALQDATYLG